MRMTSLVFPAYAGVILLVLYAFSASTSLSRVCGGDPNVVAFFIFLSPSFPRMRG